MKLNDYKSRIYFDNGTDDNFYENCAEVIERLKDGFAKLHSMDTYGNPTHEVFVNRKHVIKIEDY